MYIFVAVIISLESKQVAQLSQRDLAAWWIGWAASSDLWLIDYTSDHVSNETGMQFYIEIKMS